VLQQVSRLAPSQPAAFLGNSNWDHVELVAIDRFEDGGSREQRDFMLSRAPTKKNSNT